MSGVASSSPSSALGEGVFVALKKCIKDYVFSFISIPEGAFERNFFRLDWIFPFGRKIYIFYTLSSSLHWKMILKWLIISLYEICYTIHNFLLHFCSFKLLIICLFKDNTFEFRQLFFSKVWKNADLFNDVTVFENHQKSILREMLELLRQKWWNLLQFAKNCCEIRPFSWIFNQSMICSVGLLPKIIFKSVSMRERPEISWWWREEMHLDSN